MKTSNKLLVGLVSFLMVSILTFLVFVRINAEVTDTPRNTNREPLAGNGLLMTQFRLLPNYNGLVLHAKMDVVLTNDIDSLELEAEENLLEYITTNVNDGQLHIHWKEGSWVRPTLPIKIKAPIRSISSIVLNDDGFITSLDTLRGDTLILKNNDDADLTLSLEVKHLSVTITDNGDVELEGSANQLEANIHSSGDLDAPGLVVQNATIHNQSRGGAKLQIENQLHAELNGSGHIKFKGSATVDATANGKGRVVRMD